MMDETTVPVWTGDRIKEALQGAFSSRHIATDNDWARFMFDGYAVKVWAQRGGLLKFEYWTDGEVKAVLETPTGNLQLTRAQVKEIYLWLVAMVIGIGGPMTGEFLTCGTAARSG